MIAVQEVTTWQDIDYTAPNHVYLLNGDKIHAYIPWGSGEPQYFKKPLRIDQARRKFVELEVNPFGPQEETNLVRVEGSKGDVYYVDPEAGTCSCPGYKFRGKCRHLDQVLGAQTS